MTNELVKRLQLWEEVFPQDMDKEEGHLYQEAAERIKALTADKRFIIEERDRTFALMLARAEKAESERDEAYAKGYSDAETEISKSALGQGNAFLHSQYANAVEQIKDLNELLEEAQTDWRKYEGAWMTAEGKLADVEAERDRLREALEKLECKCSSNCDWLHDDVCPSWIARAALKEESHE